jgi:hypothetical protein
MQPVQDRSQVDHADSKDQANITRYSALIRQNLLENNPGMFRESGGQPA